MTDVPTRCGFCAIIGAPNAGKSTLVNRLAGAKVSIVTRKAQTTRSRIRAISVEGPTQIVLVDTPGIFVPRRQLDRVMVENAWGGAKGADTVVLVVDARKGLDSEVESILATLAQVKVSPILALNKIDEVAREKLLKLTGRFTEAYTFARVFMVSALSGDGVDDLKRFIAERMPEGPWLYPGDQTADIQMRFLASEITREKLYERLHDELPYASTVETESWDERKDGSVRIGQVIYVERDSQKMIVLGKGGQTIKLLGQAARAELEEMLGRKVHLFLFVKVRENWAQDPERLRSMGLEDLMEWREEGIVLGVRRHGETSAIVDVLTNARGRWMGLVRGGRSRAQRPVLQEGNLVLATWKARLEEHLGLFAIEPLALRSGWLIDDPAKLAALTTLTCFCQLLPEREPHARLYEAARLVLDALEDNDIWPALFVRWEMGLLDELGFGLDLSRCAATGSREDLDYVSPRTGRAVSRTAGTPYRERLLVLPDFLKGTQAAVPDRASVLNGFRLTGHFLERHIFEPRNIDPPDARERMIARLAEITRTAE